MKLWHYLIFLLFLLTTSSDQHQKFSLIQPSPEPIPEEPSFTEKSWERPENISKYINDYQNKVDDVFKVTDFYQSSVSFWFLIYTEFSSNHIVIHDNTNLSIIYKVLDFSSLPTKKVSNNVINILKSKITGEKVAQLKKDFDLLINDPHSLKPGPQNILKALKSADIQIPARTKDQINFYKKLQKSLRTQTGQANFIRDGIIRSLPYQDLIHSFLTHKKLPEELFAIPFLESSFNPEAESRVGASGIWQFMPLIGSYFFPKRTNEFDYRNNIAISSIGASFLMQENYLILRSWDLAVTAYNSGTKHLIKTKKRLKTKKVTLEMVIKNSDSKLFGFASKNFYSEFLALVHTLAYREEIFTDLHQNDRQDVNEPIHFFISKCKQSIHKTLNQKQVSDLLFHNHHFHDFKKSIPKGLIVSTKLKLPRTHFFEVPFDWALKHKPKTWLSKIKNYSCSTI